MNNKKKKKIAKAEAPRAKTEPSKVQAVPTADEPAKVKPEHSKVKSVPNRKARAGKRSLRNSLVAILATAAILGVLVFIIFHLNDYIAAKPKFEFISSGRVEHTIGATALIVRNEVVIPSSTTGDLVTKATEGSRVAKLQRIALVVPESMASVVTSLRNTQAQISEVRQEVIESGKADGAKYIYENNDEAIKPIVDLLRLDAMDGRLNNNSSYESSLSVIMDKREKELSKIEFNDDRIDILNKDESSYENQLEKNSSKIEAPNPGIVSYKLDGLEEKLSFDFLLTADPEEIRKVMTEADGIITSDLYIDEDENIARISQNDRQYLAVYIEGKDVKVEDFAPEKYHNINVASEGVTIDNCLVERSVPCENGLLVVFSTSRHIESLIGLRTVNIEIVINATSGLRVPTSSLVNPDYDRGVASIYINQDGFAAEVSVFIEDYDREFAIIKPFEGNVPNNKTVLITNPSSVKPGDKVV